MQDTAFYQYLLPSPTLSTSRRRPYSSYFSSYTSSVRICDSGCGLVGPHWNLSDMAIS